MTANNLKPRSLPARLWHIWSARINHSRRKWLFGYWLIDLGRGIVARNSFPEPPIIGIDTRHKAWCMVNHPECGPIHCTCRHE